MDYVSAPAPVNIVHPMRAAIPLGTNSLLYSPGFSCRKVTGLSDAGLILTRQGIVDTVHILAAAGSRIIFIGTAIVHRVATVLLLFATGGRGAALRRVRLGFRVGLCDRLRGRGLHEIGCRQVNDFRALLIDAGTAAGVD